MESLATSYTNDTLKALLERYNAIIEKEGGQKVFWNFGVTRENDQVQKLNERLEQAITQKNYITFEYRNAGGKQSAPCVEPLAIHYKWYAWYLFAYSEEKKQYRTYKVARMQNLEVLNRMSTMAHGDVERLIKEYFPDCTVVGPEEYKRELTLEVHAMVHLAEISGMTEKI